MVVPSRVLQGEAVRLRCGYAIAKDLKQDRVPANESLYSLRWYHSGQEFFSLLPARTPQVRMYKIPGIQIQGYHHNVELGGGGGSVVIDLFEIGREATGVFTCEVSGEAPQFRTTAASRPLTVVVLPKRDPLITGGRESYKVGDEVINASLLEGPFFWEEDEGTLSALRLTFAVERGHFTAGDRHEEVDDFLGGTRSGGFLRMRCVSTVENIQQLATEETKAATKKPPRKVPPKATLYVSSARKIQPSSAIVTVGMILSFASVQTGISTRPP
ncbi:hypothetical protein AAG570_006625 [Ranatra chinensis]|uniref:Ig-like domain-containing protein n=1 Tax=Ranatra chinensis TaxID=642074 RepID=A0ABD0Z545_9HEMI